MKNIYKCEFNKENVKSEMVESWVHPIPVFNVTLDDTTLMVSAGKKEKKIAIVDIKKIDVKLSTGLRTSGATNGMDYYVDFHVYFNNEDVILEFTDYENLNVLAEKLQSMNIALEDKMGLLELVKNVDSNAKRVDLYRYLGSNMKKLEREFGTIEKNRMKYKYVGNH